MHFQMRIYVGRLTGRNVHQIIRSTKCSSTTSAAAFAGKRVFMKYVPKYCPEKKNEISRRP